MQRKSLQFWGIREQNVRGKVRACCSEMVMEEDLRDQSDLIEARGSPRPQLVDPRHCCSAGIDNLRERGSYQEYFPCGQRQARHCKRDGEAQRRALCQVQAVQERPLENVALTSHVQKPKVTELMRNRPDSIPSLQPQCHILSSLQLPPCSTLLISPLEHRLHPNVCGMVTLPIILGQYMQFCLNTIPLISWIKGDLENYRV